jgi:hypothetical protein
MTQTSPPLVSEKSTDTTAERSGSVREALKRGVGFYKFAAIMLTNTIITLIVVNVLCEIVNKTWEKQVQQQKDGQCEKLFAEKYHDYTVPQMRELLKENSRPRLYEYVPYLGYKYRPVWLKYTHITPPGFRLGIDNGPWPPSPNNLNVFVFGASTTYGTRLTDEETIPSQVQAFLKGKTEKPVKVYNFGTSAYFSTLERIQFANMLAQGLKPDVAVFVDGNMDSLSFSDDPLLTCEMKELSEDRGYGLQKAISPFIHELPMTKLVTKLQEESNKRRAHGHAKTIRYNKEQVDHIIARYTANKRLIEVQAREYGVHPLFVWQPCSTYHFDQKYYPFPEPDLAHVDPAPTYERMAEKIKENAPELSKNFLWLADIQEGVTEPCYIDKAQHYRASLCKKIGSAIGQSLLDRQLLAKDTAPPLESPTR